MSHFHDQLKTFVDEIRYSYLDQTGYVIMPKAGHVDLLNAVSLFASIDKNVRRIEQFAGDVALARFIKFKKTGWSEVPIRESFSEMSGHAHNTRIVGGAK
jgi:hypothetical protein